MIPYGYCQCGCGQKTTVAIWSNTALGWVKGEPKRFVSGHNGRRSVDERFWEKVNQAPEDCWEWQGSIGPDGYGSFRGEDGKTIRAHRWSWIDLHGPVPPGLQLDHLCRNRACVRPDHLEVVTNQVNAQRGARTLLTPAQVEWARTCDLSERKAATTLGVSRGAVRAIRTGRSWTNLARRAA